jgi:hypothetical protein
MQAKPLLSDFDLIVADADLPLPNWGPYSKQFAGVSHIPAEDGRRVDFSLFAGLSGRRIRVPDLIMADGCQPWDAAPDYSVYRYRLQVASCDSPQLLQAGDDVVIMPDADSSEMNADLTVRLQPDGSGSRMLLSLENQTETAQSVEVHALCHMSYPEEWPCRLSQPDGVVWQAAIDYSELIYATPRPTDHLIADGLRRGEEKGNEWIDGRALGAGFGLESGDRVCYLTEFPQWKSPLALQIRACVAEGETASFAVRGLAVEKLEFKGTGSVETYCWEIEDISPGQCQWSLRSLGTANVTLDGFCFGEAAQLQQAKIEFPAKNHTPQIRKTSGANAWRLNFAESDPAYALALSEGDWKDEVIDGVRLQQQFPRSIPSSYAKLLRNRGLLKDSGELAALWIHGIFVIPAGETQCFDLDLALVGAEKTVTNLSKESIATAPKSATVPLTSEAAFLLSAKPFESARNRMRATTLLNLVYPTWLDGRFIRHYTPGKRWNTLYTWDSGFIGLGLACIDPSLSLACLRTYLAEPEDPSAFVHHGTPLPIQLYQFQAIWNRTQDERLLTWGYPRLRRFYEFIAGHDVLSTTRKHHSGLLQTWDYFYNSAGMDDYPPQKIVHRDQLTQSVTPVAVTATAVRFARLLKQLGHWLGRPAAELERYSADIDVWQNALNEYAWDEESGYFGYVMHDAEGHPHGILRGQGEVNLNCGVDGVYPLVSGICDADRRNRMLENLFDETKLWSPVGISSVDQSVNYYSPDGYWNGAVWLPHQWVLWKALLDIGEAERAWKIADTALKTWSRITDQTGNCYEHVNIKDQLGDGCPHFSGLSTPLLDWFDSYHTCYRLNGGHDLLIRDLQICHETASLRARLSFAENAADVSQRVVLVSLRSDVVKVRAFWKDVAVAVKSPYAGHFWVMIPAHADEGELRILPDNKSKSLFS